MRKMRTMVVAGVLAVLTAACGASTGSADSSNPSPNRQSRDRNLITQSEIQASPGQTAYDVVQRLRPRWLTIRGGSRSLMGMDTRIVVFSDNVQIGDVGVLRQIPAESVESMRFLDGATASNVLPGVGSGEHIAGAIVVTRLRGGD